MIVSKGVFITTSLCAQPAAIGRNEWSLGDASRSKLRQFSNVRRNPARHAVPCDNLANNFINQMLPKLMTLQGGGGGRISRLG
jgi:hypothetical protein